MDKLEMLMQDRGMTLFDCIMTEIMNERNAEKARVRNRRKADRKAKRKSGAYVKRNGGNFRKSEHYAGDGRMWHDTYNWDLSKSQTGGKIRERSLRKDYDAEIRQHEDALAYHSDYLDMAIDHGERLEYLRKQIRKLDYERMIIANYDQEIKYEQNRVNELMRIADTIMEGECY